MGPYIKQLREEKGLTKSQLSSGICSVSYISRIENGERYPTSLILGQIASKLGSSVSQLFIDLDTKESYTCHELLKEIFTGIRRHSFVEIKKLIDEKNLSADNLSVGSAQTLRLFDCISTTVLEKDYDKGLAEMDKILSMTYSSVGDITDMEFSVMFVKGLFYLMKNENQSAYELLKGIEKHIGQVKYFRDLVILGRYYVLASTASLDTKHLEDANRYINTGIDYCKSNNVTSLLRELYYLKAELLHESGDHDGYLYWKKNAELLHELICSSEDEEFESWMKSRSYKIEHEGGR